MDTPRLEASENRAGFFGEARALMQHPTWKWLAGTLIVIVIAGGGWWLKRVDDNLTSIAESLSEAKEEAQTARAERSSLDRRMTSVEQGQSSKVDAALLDAKLETLRQGVLSLDRQQQQTFQEIRRLADALDEARNSR